MLLLAALVVLGVVLAVVVIKWLFILAVVAALIWLILFFVRRTAKEAAVFRAWGYPWAPALFCLVGFAIVINTFIDPGGRGVALAGLAVMAAGVPIYWWVKRNGKRET